MGLYSSYTFSLSASSHCTEKWPSNKSSSWQTGGGGVKHAFWDLWCLIPTAFKSFSPTQLPLPSPRHLRDSSLRSATCVEHLLAALHARHGLHILTPVTHFRSEHLGLRRKSYILKHITSLRVSYLHLHPGWTSGMFWNYLNIREFWYLVLFDVLLLHRLEVGSEVHGALVFGAQQSSHHLVCWHPHLPQGGLLELASEVLDLQLQLMNLRRAKVNT